MSNSNYLQINGHNVFEEQKDRKWIFVTNLVFKIVLLCKHSRNIPTQCTFNKKEHFVSRLLAIQLYFALHLEM